MKRREFILKTGSAMLASGAILGNAGISEAAVKGKFDISVAAWSWHKMFFNGEITQIDQPGLVRKAGATGLELVNAFFPSPQYGYLKRLMKTAKDEGVKILLIMCDDEGNMSGDFKERQQSVINHRKWIDIAAVMGCHSIRCNSGNGHGSPEENMKLAADSFNELSQYARQYNINVTIENHGGISSDPRWLTGLMKMVGEDNFGTLPDFGNFPRKNGKFAIDIYEAIDMMMPYAKAVSAKCFDFGEDGNETTIDFTKMMGIVLDAGYNGFVGVEYEGNRMSELDGTKACVDLLKRFQA